MGLEFLALPRATGLVALISLKAELGITDSDDDALLGSLITAASHSIMAALGAPPWRAKYRENLFVSNGNVLPLGARPIASVDAATVDEAAYSLADLTIANAFSGLVRVGAIDEEGAAGEWVVDTTAGWFCPDDDYAGSVSVIASDSSYNSAAADFHPYLAPGDWIQALGFSNPANNGAKKVVSATTSKIVVAQTLINENAASARSFALRTLPGPLERACVETVRDWFLRRGSASAGTLISKTIAGVTLQYSNLASLSASGAGIPASARSLCRPWALISA